MFRFLQLFKIPVDILLIFGAFLSAYHLRDNAPFFSFLQLSGNNLLPWENYQDFAIQGSVLLFLMLVLKGFYSLKNPLKFTQAIPTIWLVTTAWLMIMIAYFFFTRQLFFSRLVIVYIYLFVFSYLVFSHGVFRSIEHSLKAYGFGRQRVLFVGTGKLVERLAKSLNRKKEYTIIGSLDRVRRSSPKNTVKIIDSIDNIEQVIDQQKVDHIIQTNSKLITVHDDTVFEICRDKNIKYSFIPDIMELYAKNIETKDIDGLPLIEMKPSPLEAWGAVNKAIFDKTAALFGLIALSPLFAIIATLIKIDSQWPIIYKSYRVGEKGKLVPFYKFRSMISDAEAMKKKLQSDRHGPLFKMKNDPRITKLGRILRKTSLDELPQLWSVLIGDMSLVWPRPHLPEEVTQYKKGQKFVLTIKPGITGLAQVSGRSDINFDQEVKLDTSYIENWSVGLDIIILIKTFLIVIKPQHNE